MNIVSPSIPTVEARETSEVLSLAGLRALGSGVLEGFLRERRWFGRKAARVTRARVRDVVRLPWEGNGDGRYAVARVEVEFEGGATRLYQLPLALGTPERTPAAVVARVRAPEGEVLLFDATESETFLRRLAAALATGGSFGAEGDGARWIIAPEGAQGLVVPPAAEVRVESAEQSNTSIVFADAGVLKLFRALEAGEHPEVELTRYLTVDAGFAHTPTLLGTVRFEEPDGTVTMAGMLQEYLSRSTDGWAFAVERARGYLSAPRADAPNEFAPKAERLGAVTRAMHEALARAPGALAAAPATADDVAHWADGARRWIDTGMDLLTRAAGVGAGAGGGTPASGGLPGERRGEAEALVRRKGAYVAFVDEIVSEVGNDAGLRIRVHGDYHLGQVLRTASDDLMIIDFEGEPARPLAERREKTSALRDVAGMLRSFGYVAAEALGAGGARREADVEGEIRAGRWERDVRSAFLRGYFAGGGTRRRETGARSSGLLPANDEHTRRLLALFETAKAFYELAYELNNRPDWAWIPMRGISKLLVA